MTSIETQILTTPLPQDNGAGADTIQGYLIALLLELWEQGEDMVKRPFGSSGWQYDLYKALIKADLVGGSLDEDGYVKELDHAEADDLIMKAIRSLGV